MKLSTCAYFILATLAMAFGYISTANSWLGGVTWSPKTDVIIDTGMGVNYTPHQNYVASSQYTTCCPLTNGVPNCSFDISEGGVVQGTQDAALFGSSTNGTGNVEGHQALFDGPAQYTITLHYWCYVYIPSGPQGQRTRGDDLHGEVSYQLNVEKQASSKPQLRKPSR